MPEDDNPDCRREQRRKGSSQRGRPFSQASMTPKHRSSALATENCKIGPNGAQVQSTRTSGRDRLNLLVAALRETGDDHPSIEALLREACIGADRSGRAVDPWRITSAVNAEPGKDAAWASAKWATAADIRGKSRYAGIWQIRNQLSRRACSALFCTTLEAMIRTSISPRSTSTG